MKFSCRYSGMLIMAIVLVFNGHIATAQNDTLKVMAYNVLNYGFDCQGPVARYHQYLKTIVDYVHPDILTLEKMASIPMYPGDISGKAPVGFADSILMYALNAGTPGKFTYAPISNNAGADNICMLFYNQQKLGFAGVTFNYSNVTDFNCYKLFYKDPNLAETHDTTFLYIIPNHDISGSAQVSDRAAQISGYMALVQQHFSHLPNMITMGDFNLRYTIEPLYQTLTAPADTGFRFFDPPFFPDNNLSYPANWDLDPASFSAYLTTSTRALATVPNSCGTGGGAKSWYDHIFISPWLADNSNYMHYIPGSYKTIGNDGHRLGISANDTIVISNNSAPQQVVEAIYQMSNKYPVTIDIAVMPDSSGLSPIDPEINNTTGIRDLASERKNIAIVNPAKDFLNLHFPDEYKGNNGILSCYDCLGELIFSKTITVAGNHIQLPFNVATGTYVINIRISNKEVYRSLIVKE